MCLAEPRVDGRPHKVLNIEWLDDPESRIRRSVVEYMNFDVAERLTSKAFQACCNIESTIERHDIYRNFRCHHFFDCFALSDWHSLPLMPFNAPMKVLPYLAAWVGLPIIRPIIPAAIDTRTIAVPNAPKCFLA